MYENSSLRIFLSPPIFFPLFFVLLYGVLYYLQQKKYLDRKKYLLDLIPKRSKLLIDNDLEVEVDTHKIQPGDLVAVAPQQRIPTDGVVVFGSSYLYESEITYASKPIPKGPGSVVFAGSLNKHGSLVYRATRVGESSFLGQISALSDYKNNHILLLTIAIILSVLGYLLRRSEHYTSWSQFILLICLSPYALLLNGNFLFQLAQESAARLGVLARTKNALIALTQFDTLIFPYRGLLSSGKPKISSIYPLQNNSEERILNAASAIERGNDHPIAAALLMETRIRRLPVAYALETQSAPGAGVFGQLEDEEIYVGSKRFTGANDEHQSIVEQIASQGETPTYIKIQEKIAGIFGLYDPLKETNDRAIAALKKLKISLILATGEDRSIADFLSKKYQLDHTYAEISDEKKEELLKTLSSEGMKIAILNKPSDRKLFEHTEHNLPMGYMGALDSPSLFKDELLKLCEAILLSYKMISIKKQNLIIFIAYHLGALYLVGKSTLIAHSSLFFLALSILCFLAIYLNCKRIIIHANE